VIRIDAVWLAVAPMDMRAGPDTALARVVAVFGSAQPHHAYVFANARATRIAQRIAGPHLGQSAERRTGARTPGTATCDPTSPISLATPVVRQPSPTSCAQRF